jgi:membrane protease YdiL (CAAX protease family)
VFAGLAASLIALIPLGGEATTLELFGLMVPAQTGGTLGAVAVLARRRTEWRTALLVQIDRRDVMGLLVGGGLQLSLTIVAYWLLVVLLGGDAPSQEMVEAVSDVIGGGERVLVVLGVAFLAPISEELVFRGILLAALRRTRGDRFAVFGSATAFAMLHLLDPNAILAIPFLFVVGVVAGRAVITTGRLGRAVAIHAGFNLVTVLALFAA